MSGLYAIIDVDFLRSAGVPLLPFAEAVLQAGPRTVQLRAKSATARDTLSHLRSLRPLCARNRVALFANDRPDLAVIAGCDGVHVGQGDLEIADVRRIAPGLRVGVSTHDPGQLEVALAAAPDYIAYGPVFPTSSKVNPDPVVGIDGLRQVAQRCKERGVPLVAIGGIDVARAAEVAAYADQAAVIGALLPEGGLPAVLARALELVRALA